MRFRTLALALALTCGVTGTMEAKQKSSHSRKNRKLFNARKVKARKVKHHA
jgi:hypothetical protein